MAKRNIILALTGFTLFFLVMGVFYIILIYTDNNPQVLTPLIPFIIFSGFFIFLIAAFLVAMAVSQYFRIAIGAAAE